jgi:phospholipid-binding lipoprotein MlaA
MRKIMTLQKPETLFKVISINLTWVIVILGIFTGGCAVSEKMQSTNIIESSESTGDDDFDLLEDEFSDQQVTIADPLEPFNRLMFNVNDGLYYLVVEPVTGVYTAITPKPVKLGIRNFFDNLVTPIRFVNCHLQGKTDAADIELTRFLINSSFGILGFGDPAKDQHGLESPKPEDFGQTLATYGIGDGFYLVLPLLGPTTARDGIGKGAGMFLNPVYYLECANAAATITAVRVTNESSFHVGEYENFKADAVDPYVAMRDIYMQYRRKQIKE